MLAVLFLNRRSLQQKRLLELKGGPDKSMKPKLQNSNYCCRTCLSSSNLEPLFGDGNEFRRSEELRIVTGLEIKINDGLAQFICSDCIRLLETSLKFRRKSRKTGKTLLGLLTGKTKRKTKKTITKCKESEDIDTPMNNYENYSFEMNNDGFQDNDNYEPNEEQPVFKEKKSVVRARSFIPNAASYKCGTCNKEFRMKATYKSHVRFHTNFCVCESCGKRCRNNNQLQEHKRARHGLGRIHKCAFCEYSSATKEALTIHERRHTGERPYVCDHCGASFHRRSNLVQHIAVHLPHKNFQCDMCPKRLASRKFLQIHKHNAHIGKKYGYLCAVCSHRFEKPNKVRAHARRVHGLADDQQGAIVRVQV